MPKNPNQSNIREKVINIAAIGAVAAAAGLAIEHNTQQPSQIAGHNKVYVAKPGDTEWTIAQRAFPNLDPRLVLSYINHQEPQTNQASNTVVPGEKFYFSGSSKIGTEVPSHSSVS